MEYEHITGDISMGNLMISTQATLDGLITVIKILQATAQLLAEFTACLINQ